MAYRNKKADRRIIHCLLCEKPQENITGHLARVCMKNKTAKARRAEVLRAKDSMEAWICQGRTWDYNEMCRLWPHKPSRLAVLDEGCLVTNAPRTGDLGQPSAAAAESTPRASGGPERVSAAEEGPNSGSCKQELRCIQPRGLDNSTIEDLDSKCQAYIDFLNTIKEQLLEELNEEERKVSSTEESGDRRTKAQKKSREADEDERQQDFSEFLKSFPVTLVGQPPNTKQRVLAGFSEDRVFYDKWRGHQFNKREEHLLSKCTRRPPAPNKVLKDIRKEGWNANHPDPEDIVAKWRPAPKTTVERDPKMMKMVTKQRWSGLSIREFQGDKGHGVVATKRFPKGSILCDYHGEVITEAEGRKMQEAIQDQTSYLFFFSSGSQKLCVDAQTFPCQCHPDRETIGRKINHSRKKPNVQPVHCLMRFAEGERRIILFKALKDISVDEEIRFDHGLNRKSYRGEGLDLEWLDD